MKYITTLSKAIAQNDTALRKMGAADDEVGEENRIRAIQKGAYFEVVMAHCTDFAMRCSDTSDSYMCDPDISALHKMKSFLQGLMHNQQPSRSHMTQGEE